MIMFLAPCMNFSLTTHIILSTVLSSFNLKFIWVIFYYNTIKHITKTETPSIMMVMDSVQDSY